jgi:cyanophycinase
MTVFLVGGGWDESRARELYGGFVGAARERAGGAEPRVLLVLLGTDEESLEYHEKYLHTLGLVGGHTLDVERLTEGSVFDPARLEGVHGLFVGGGPTPEYHASLSPAYAEIRALVADGLPYAGFSAGAAIAAREAIVGGWRVEGVPVCAEESGEELDELTVVEGLGLLEGAVDVHAAQWGTVSRLVAAVDARRVVGGVAIDEATVLVLGPDGEHVAGAGSVWRVAPGAGGVLVRRD